LAGLGARALGVRAPAGKAELAVPLLARELLPPAQAGLALGVIAIGALVPAAVMSVAAASTFASNIYLEYVNPTAIPAQVTRVAKVVSVLVKLGALVFVLGLRAQDAITLQLLGGVWILQTLPSVLLGLRLRSLHRYALLAGLGVGLALGTWLVAAQGFVAVTRFTVGGVMVGVYAGLVALTANLAVAVALTTVLDRLGVTRGVDSTGAVLSGIVRREWEVEE
jgi:SSS family solute:Na+ symporter